MLEFFMAQSTDPFDPTPLLILADYLGGAGRCCGGGGAAGG